MAKVLVYDDEPIDGALKRFKKVCQKEGIFSETRKRRFYEKPSEKRKRKEEAAARKMRRRMAKLKRRLDRA